MRGYLFVEEDMLGIPNNTFTKRYFVSFPYCGLKWFLSEPHAINSHKLLLTTTSEATGWMFNAGLIPSEISASKSIQSNRITLYPFTVTMRYNEHVTTLSLATDDEDMRQKWIYELNALKKM